MPPINSEETRGAVPRLGSSPPGPLTILCWACGVLVQVPVVNNALAPMFRCGWCGAISEAAPADVSARRPRTGGPWRSCMRLLTRLTYVVVLFVLGLMLSILLPGVGLLLPRMFPYTLSWLVHVSISYVLMAAVLWNYLAAVFTSPGTPLECCADVPPAFQRARSRRAATAAAAAAGEASSRKVQGPGPGGATASDEEATGAGAGAAGGQADGSGGGSSGQSSGSSEGAGGAEATEGCSGIGAQPGSGATRPGPTEGRDTSSGRAVSQRDPSGAASVADKRGGSSLGEEPGDAASDAGREVGAGGATSREVGASGATSREDGGSGATSAPAPLAADEGISQPGLEADTASDGGGGDGAASGKSDGAPSPSPPPPSSSEAVGPDAVVGAGAGAAGAQHPLVPQFAFSHFRYCWQCRGPQPSVARHCYPCGLCVVDQDHHCPFINNCVGRANMRNFLSFLAATLLAMVYCAVVSSLVLAQSWEEARESMHDAAAAVEARMPAAAAAAAAAATAAASERGAGGGGDDTASHGGLGGRLFSWGFRLLAGLDWWFAFFLVFISRTPLHITAAAYILLASVGIFCALAVLFAQSLEHAAAGAGHAGTHLAAQHAARHNLHPASDAAAEAVRGGRRRRWSVAFANLRRVMCGVEPVTCGDAAGTTVRSTVRCTHDKYGSAWLWVWPLWGPPPGVLVPEAEALQALEPDRRSRTWRRPQLQPGTETAGSVAAGDRSVGNGGTQRGVSAGQGASRQGAMRLSWVLGEWGWGLGWVGRKAKTQ